MPLLKKVWRRRRIMCLYMICKCACLVSLRANGNTVLSLWQIMKLMNDSFIYECIKCRVHYILTWSHHGWALWIHSSIYISVNHRLHITDISHCLWDATLCCLHCVFLTPEIFRCNIAGGKLNDTPVQFSFQAGSEFDALNSTKNDTKLSYSKRTRVCVIILCLFMLFVQLYYCNDNKDFQFNSIKTDKELLKISKSLLRMMFVSLLPASGVKRVCGSYWL